MVHRVPPSVAKATEATTKTKAPKQIAKLAEDVFHRHTSTREATTTIHLVIAFRPQLVVASTLVGVAEDIIGLGSLLKFFFSVLLLGIAFSLLTVGVILNSKLAISFFQSIGIGIAINP